MSKAEQFIKDYTMKCSNELCYEEGLGNLYEPWLSPEQALRAVEIAREEIKAKIEGLIKSYSPIWSSEGKYRIEAYKEVLDFINSNCLEISRNGNSHIGENGDLEKAAAGYAREQLANPDYPTYNDEYEIECAFETGAKWQKEQLMKDAMDGVVFTKLDDGSIMVRTHYFKSNKIDYLDEVKLIIIKEK